MRRSRASCPSRHKAVLAKCARNGFNDLPSTAVQSLRQTRRSSGFTLLEILVAIAIIAILTGAALIALGGFGRQSDAQTTAEQLAALLRLAAEESALTGREIGLRVEDSQFSFLVLADNAWLPLDSDPLFRSRPLPDGLDIEIIMNGAPVQLLQPEDDDDDQDEETNNSADTTDAPADETEIQQVAPQIVVLSSGGLTPFEMRVSTLESPTAYVVRGDLIGTITVEAAP